MHRLLRHSLRRSLQFSSLGEQLPTDRLFSPPSCFAAAACDAHRRAWSSDSVAPAAPAGDARQEEEGRMQIQPRLAMVFTCGRCNTRAVKSFSRQAYENGVVLVDCPGCQVRHVIADRKGWFGNAGSVEDFLAEKGETVIKRGGFAGQDSLEFTEAELLGWSNKRNDAKD